MERFTQRARRVLSLAQEEAERLQHGQIGTEHLLLGLMREEGGVAGRVLRDLGLEQRRVEELVVRLTTSGERRAAGSLELSAGTKKVLELAVDEARRMGHHYIGTEHLLLGLIRQPEGIAIEVLQRLGVTPEEVRRQTRRVLKESPMQSTTPARPERPSRGKADKTPLVDQLATDLTAAARDGKLDPVVGRQTEIERVIQVLS
ncbi:MAG: Clp protease N-terminal domain-containing protein, partial [Aggregatilineales bacterium]